MWFCLWPIDLYLLDERKRVADVKKGFRPWSWYAPRAPFRYAVETRPGLLRVREGEPLRF